ncbi:MAG: CBS domain-containing protein [Spirochaetales bacterium]|uniref:CBS domain-containing protein n=1 Tax=Candidatus Thalassospirochaeta sargassi TaxID=3119039 RepID=A0AAJ1MK86_9SPIO|nr:CBS domain-containing protein [Spirochaetales bacterium]
MIKKLIPVYENQTPLVVLELIQGHKISEIMSTNVISVTPDITMRDVKKMMKDGGISGMPVVRQRRLIGIISVEDLLNALEDGLMDDSVEKHMSRNPVILEEQMPVSFAIDYFENYSYNRFPVLNENKELVGMLTGRDIIMHMVKVMNREIGRLEEIARYGHHTEIGNVIRRYAVVQNDFKNAGKASSEVKTLLQEHKVDRKVIRAVATAIYELEINQVVHSLGGEIVCRISDHYVEVLARDRGPGIEDIEKALSEGFSTATDWIRSMGFGAGMGLPNVKRVSDDFQIQSSTAGTEIKVTINLPVDNSAEKI